MFQLPSVPLDPDARVLIDRLNAVNAPGYETMRPATARAIVGQLERNAPIPAVRVAGTEDFTLDTGSQPMPARLYRPFGPVPDGGYPTLVYLHGGGWVLGDLETMDHLCRTLVRHAGIAVVSLDYPLAPETQFPAVHEAIAAALRDLVARAPALSLDPARLALGGDSAGGNLSAVLALMARDAGGPDLKALCLIYPALDLPRYFQGEDWPEDSLFLRRPTVEWFIDCYLGDRANATDWRASPALASNLSGLPPSMILTAGYDLLRDEGTQFAARLDAAGVTTVLKDFPGQIHHFLAFPHVIPTAYAALEAVSEFLVAHLHGDAGA